MEREPALSEAASICFAAVKSELEEEAAPNRELEKSDVVSFFWLWLDA